MKKIICGIAMMLILMGAARIDKTLLLTMDLVDTVGYTFNISTIEYIDKLNEINKRIHICKRSCGWQIGFDHNNGEYYQPTRKSLEEFLSQPGMVIFDEYNNEYTYEEFWKEIDEHNANPYNNYDSKKYIENQIKYNYPPDYICKSDINKVKEIFGIETTVNDFYNDGLRWIVFTDFS